MIVGLMDLGPRIARFVPVNGDKTCAQAWKARAGKVTVAFVKRPWSPYHQAVAPNLTTAKSGYSSLAILAKRLGPVKTTLEFHKNAPTNLMLARDGPAPFHGKSRMRLPA